jgi:hypothetical protein
MNKTKSLLSVRLFSYIINYELYIILYPIQYMSNIDQTRLEQGIYT